MSDTETDIALAKFEQVPSNPEDEEYITVYCPLCDDENRFENTDDYFASNKACIHFISIFVLACGDIYGLFTYDEVDYVYSIDKVESVTEVIEV
jgi:hypothetical protein